MSEEPKYRDAESGEYVTEEYAKAHPKTTVAERDEPTEVLTGDELLAALDEE